MQFVERMYVQQKNEKAQMQAKNVFSYSQHTYLGLSSMPNVNDKYPSDRIA